MTHPACRIWSNSIAKSTRHITFDRFRPKDTMTQIYMRCKSPKLTISAGYYPFNLYYQNEANNKRGRKFLCPCVSQQPLGNAQYNYDLFCLTS